MGLLSQLFGKRSASPTIFLEKDNRGTRHDTLGFADSFWTVRVTRSKHEPFVVYSFDTAEAAREALLELPCIHVAEDTDELICTEVLDFGYYTDEKGRCEAVVCGDDLTHELWAKAKESFVRHGGQPGNQGELEPTNRAAPAEKQAPRAAKVVFVREDRQSKMGSTLIYRIHRAPDAASAKAFLEQNPVTQKLYYLVVETPEGDYCRDIQGMYKE